MGVRTFLKRLFSLDTYVEVQGPIDPLEAGKFNSAPDWGPTPTYNDYVDGPVVDYKKKYETLHNAVENCFKMQLNLNDFYFWGCADCEEIDGEDMVELIPTMEELGVWCVFGAYGSVKRGNGVAAAEQPQPPVMKMIGQENWDKAVAAVLKLASNGTIMHQLWWEREGRQAHMDANPEYKAWYEKMQAERKAKLDAENEKK
jgi:hypothetical protein